MLSWALVACSACAREPARVTKAALPPPGEASSGEAAATDAAGTATSEPAQWQQLPGGVRLLQLGKGTLRVSLDDRRYQPGFPERDIGGPADGHQATACGTSRTGNPAAAMTALTSAMA